jgi:hypothetical protein
MTELVAKARRLGIEPGDYAKRLIEDGLILQREAEEKSFAQIMAPVRNASGNVSEEEVMTLVESARADHHGANRSRKRR